MTDKTQIEKDVAEARAKVAKAQAAWDDPRFSVTGPVDIALEYECDAALTNLKVARTELFDLLSSTAFAAQFDALVEEYAEAKSRADYYEEEGGYSPGTTPDWDAVNTARARLREFVIGESK